MKKSFRCTVNLNGFRKTGSGKQKVWRTDNIITHCCSLTPSIFIWEKDTHYNHYEGYSGYVHPNVITIL